MAQKILVDYYFYVGFRTKRIHIVRFPMTRRKWIRRKNTGCITTVRSDSPPMISKNIRINPQFVNNTQVALGWSRYGERGDNNQNEKIAVRCALYLAQIVTYITMTLLKSGPIRSTLLE